MTLIKNRRQFLSDSLVAAAAASVGLAVKPIRSEHKVSANGKIGMAIVGFGNRGKGHARQYALDPRTTVLYVCDPDPSREEIGRLDGLAKMQDGIRPKFVKDMRRVLSDPAVDAVNITSPNHWHGLHALWSLQAGKHCYIEKPLSYNIHESQVITAAAKKYGKIVQTGTQCRSNPANIEAVKFVREGGIGEAKWAHCILYTRRKAIGKRGDYPVPEGVDYDLYCGPARYDRTMPRPRLHYDWHWQRDYGNGDIGNRGPHQTDIARWHLNLDRYPNSVISYGGRLGYDIETEDPDYIDAGDTTNSEISILDYGDKAIVFEMRGLDTKPYFGSCRNWPGIDFGVAVHGTQGFLMQIDYVHSIAFDSEGNAIKEFKGGDDQLHYSNFVDALLSGDSSILKAPVRDGALSVGICHLMDISYYSGEKNHASPAEIATALENVKTPGNHREMLARFVGYLEAFGVDLKKTPLSLGPELKFDPKRERFIDNESADRMISRSEYRKPYPMPDVDQV